MTMEVVGAGGEAAAGLVEAEAGSVEAANITALLPRAVSTAAVAAAAADSRRILLCSAGRSWAVGRGRWVRGEPWVRLWALRPWPVVGAERLRLCQHG